MNAGDFIAIGEKKRKPYQLKPTITPIEGAFAGKLVKKGKKKSKVSVIDKSTGERVLKIINISNKFIHKTIDPYKDSWEYNQLTLVFKGLPDFLILGKQEYELHTSNGRSAAIEKVKYIQLDPIGRTVDGIEYRGYEILFETEAPTLFDAVHNMTAILQKNNYL